MLRTALVSGLAGGLIAIWLMYFVNGYLEKLQVTLSTCVCQVRFPASLPPIMLILFASVWWPGFGCLQALLLC